jgi:hypothetical protein
MTAPSEGKRTQVASLTTGMLECWNIGFLFHPIEKKIRSIKKFIEESLKLILKPLSQIQKLFGFDHYSIVPLFHHSIGVGRLKMSLG